MNEAGQSEIDHSAIVTAASHDTEASSAWKPMHREDFPPGSLGRAQFLPELEGRERPETILDRQLTSEFHPRIMDRLGHLIDTLRTCRDLANLPVADAENMKDPLRLFFRRLLVTPQGRLIRDVTGANQAPVSVEEEKLLVPAVNRAVARLVLPADVPSRTAVNRIKTIDPQHEAATIIRLFYGLTNGLPLTLAQIAGTEGFNDVAATNIGAKKRKALWALGRDPTLWDFNHPLIRML